MRQVDVEGTRVFALCDCAPPASACAWSFPEAELAEHPAAADRWLEGGLFRTRFGPFLLRSANGDALVDCGMGPGPSDYFPGLRGQLPSMLEAAGSALERVKAVLFTHLHVDHVGWAPYLPSARFFVAEQEWAHWSQGIGLAHHVQAITRCIAPLVQEGRVEVIQAGTEVLPGIMMLPAFGHTPGHCGALLHERLFIAGDTWHNPAQVEVPAWCHRADMDKAMAVATRSRLAEEAERSGWIVAAGHFTGPNVFGHVIARAGGYALAPVTE